MGDYLSSEALGVVEDAANDFLKRISEARKEVDTREQDKKDLIDTEINEPLRSGLTFDEYQDISSEIYSGSIMSLLELLSCCRESMEAVEAILRIKSHTEGRVSGTGRASMCECAADLAYCITRIADALEVPLSAIAEVSLDKAYARIPPRGWGDDR